jgi:2-hydroxy-6-oxonona-2,4-dienedioate hydrolase
MFAKRKKNRGVFLAATLPVAGAGAAMWMRYRRDIRRERERVSTGSQIAETGRGPIEYATAGAGPPVLLIHGAGGGYDQGLLLGRPLLEKGFRVIAPSRFGYLGTPLPDDASAQAQADAHAALLDTLGIDRVAVLGASAGAPSAMQFALRHPDRTAALVLLVPAAFAPREGGAPPVRIPRGTHFLFETALKSDFLFWAASRLARETVNGSILGTPPWVVKNTTSAERGRVAEMLRLILPVTARRAGLLNDEAVIRDLPRYDLERIAVPTLAISVPDDLYGTYDGARYTAEHVPGARFQGYPWGGHLLVGHNDEAASQIAAFLKENQSSGEPAPRRVKARRPIPEDASSQPLPS